MRSTPAATVAPPRCMGHAGGAGAGTRCAGPISTGTRLQESQQSSGSPPAQRSSSLLLPPPLPLGKHCRHQPASALNPPGSSALPVSDAGSVLQDGMTSQDQAKRTPSARLHGKSGRSGDAAIATGACPSAPPAHPCLLASAACSQITRVELCSEPSSATGRRHPAPEPAGLPCTSALAPRSPASPRGQQAASPLHGPVSVAQPRCSLRGAAPAGGLTPRPGTASAD